MKRTFLRPCMIAVLGTACTLTSLFANTLVPGATVSPDSFTTSNATLTLLASITETVNPVPGSSFDATYTEAVAADTSNVFCSGCLDFFLSVSNSGPTLFERLSTASFGTFLLDVGYVAASPGVAPSTVDRSASGTVIGFNFLGSGVTSGQSTAVLEIQTNATSYTTGTVSVQDGTSGFAAGFAPASAPEPASMFLLGTGAILIGSVKKLMGNRKKA